MLKFVYSLKNLAPVTFTEKSGDGVLYATKRYVPGSALRGALAALYIRKHNLKDAHLDPVFYDLFLSGKVRYLPAYPKVEGKAAETLVMPLSLMVSKDGEKVKDYSADIEMEAGYKKLSGFAVVDHKENKLYQTSADVQIEFHMSRKEEAERILGSSKEGNVFNYEYLEPYQSFTGSIILNDDCKELLPKLEELFCEKLHLGRSRNAQYGTCKIALNKKQVAADEVPVEAKKYYLYAHTEYLPYYSWQRVDTAAKEIFSSLEHSLRYRNFDVKLTPLVADTYAGVTAVDSYVGVWKLKRERKNAVAAGSLLGFKAEGMTENAWQALQELLLAGMGERIAEGYGQFRLWKPLQNVVKDKPDAEEGTHVNLHAEVKARARAIITQHIIEEVHKQAQEDAYALGNVDSVKGTLKNLEMLMDCDKSKQALQAAIADFRDPAKKNLRKVHIAGANALDCLLEENNAEMPYAQIQWWKKLELAKDTKNALEKDLGKDAFTVSEDVIFREYWLWLARFAGKKNKNQQARTTMQDKFENAIKEGAR